MIIQQKIGLSKNGFFLSLAVFGFVVKTYYNQDLYEIIKDRHITHDFVNDTDFKKAVSQNDIGELPLFKNPSMISETKNYEEFF